MLVALMPCIPEWVETGGAAAGLLAIVLAPYSGGATIAGYVAASLGFLHGLNGLFHC
jgi:hypothetical protein